MVNDQFLDLRLANLNTQLILPEKFMQWVGEIEKPAEIADSQPHASYGAITHGKWSFLSRTTPDIDYLLVPIKTSIQTMLVQQREAKSKTTKLQLQRYTA